MGWTVVSTADANGRRRCIPDWFGPGRKRGSVDCAFRDEATKSLVQDDDSRLMDYENPPICRYITTVMC